MLTLPLSTKNTKMECKRLNQGTQQVSSSELQQLWVGLATPETWVFLKMRCQSFVKKLCPKGTIDCRLAKKKEFRKREWSRNIKYGSQGKKTCIQWSEEGEQLCQCDAYPIKGYLSCMDERALRFPQTLLPISNLRTSRYSKDL